MPIAREIVLKPYTKTGVKLSPPITRLPYMDLARFGIRYGHLYVAPEEVKRARSKAFYVIVSSFHSKRVHLPKVMVVAHCTEPPLLMIDIP